MKLHEHQAKELLKPFGVPVPQGFVAFSVAEAEAAGEKLGGKAVVKAQIHAGGRGKAGGVKLAQTATDIKAHAKEILGKVLVTKQTGPEGKEVKRLLIEQISQIEKELYVAILLDRATSRNMIMASSEGGMDIEEVAEKSPEKILKISIDPVVGLQGFQCRDLAYGLGLHQYDEKLPQKFTQCLTGLYAAYLALDCAMLEINPLIVTKAKDILVLDCKMQIEDNAMYRHPSFKALSDPNEETVQDIKAHEAGLNYIELSGSIGCMVNGAGLAMATMDIIKLHGGDPANFLDVGGGANQEQVSTAFKLLVSDPKVKAIFVNIFGGIMRCDVIAEGIVAAAKNLSLKVPLTVRLQGTNVDEGKKILAKSGLNIASFDDLTQAAKNVVSQVRG